MNPEKVTRLPVQHLIYVKEYLRTGSQQHAYAKAYPGAQPDSCRSAASRLSKQPSIQQLIDEKLQQAAEKGLELATHAATERYTNDFLSINERRAELASIVRRQARMNRYYKFKEEVKTIDVPVDSPFAIMRAIELDTRLEAEYLAKKPASRQQPDAPPCEEKFTMRIYIEKEPFEGKDEPLTDDQYAQLLKLSLTNPDVCVVGPTLTDKLESLGCEVQRDMETGEYAIVCPADKIIAREENGKMQYYELREEPPEPLTNVNNETPQTLDEQHIEQNLLMQHSEHIQQVPTPVPSATVPAAPPPSTITGNGWQQINQVIARCRQQYTSNPTPANRQIHANMQKLQQHRHNPAQRLKLERLTGWQLHPQNRELVKKSNTS